MPTSARPSEPCATARSITWPSRLTWTNCSPPSSRPPASPSRAPLKFSADKQLPAHVVAKSPLMQAVFHDASLIAASESRMLITGESGVGKEVLADVIHAWSARAAGPAGQSQLRGHSRERCWKASCSGTRRARSPARWRSASAASRWPTTAPSSWMKSPTCRRRCRPSCCA